MSETKAKIKKEERHCLLCIYKTNVYERSSIMFCFVMLLSTNRLTWDIEPEVEVYTRQAGPSHIQQVEAIILHFYFMVIQ